LKVEKRTQTVKLYLSARSVTCKQIADRFEKPCNQRGALDEPAYNTRVPTEYHIVHPHFDHLEDHPKIIQK